MLNKIKNIILPMLDTLGEALTQYLAMPSEQLLDETSLFIDAINAPLTDEIPGVAELSQQLKASLKNPIFSDVERLYNAYCAAIEAVPVQYKAVFLPYYADTWDSLASVYEAFAADPMFVTEIVIIPIIRNTPGGLKTVYEDYLTPNGIPNTHFSAYSFETDLPDFVFYNNPYDGVNIEKFKSYNIKPHTGCMVYVPYFLYQHILRDKATLESEMQLFTQLSGHDYSDIFIAQGKSFLNTFAHLSRNGQKMAVLGNPKTDNIYRHICDYPRYAEWDKVTQGKTVLLLNTHFRYVATGEYKSFLPALLEFIEQNDDLALIWRPHPQSFLMLDEDGETENCLEWRRCLDIVRKHERMILDRTSSDISAIMYSDAVLSHESSIISESIFADKPVFLLETPKQEQKYDMENLFLASAVCYYESSHTPELKEELMLKFINDIRNGIDSKKELRSIFREQLFVNFDGNCGQKIHDYITGLL